MTIILYDYKDLEEKAGNHLRLWKAWHLVLYAFAAIFGIVNYVILQETMQLVDGNCVFYPRTLEFKTIEIFDKSDHVATNRTDIVPDQTEIAPNTTEITPGSTEIALNVTRNAQLVNSSRPDDAKNEIKREVKDYNGSSTEFPITEETAATENLTHRLVLDTSRTLFGPDNKCNFAEYMPVMSTVFAAVWLTMFTMCPSGGRARTGLQQPWRILMPALLFTLVMVGLTGHSFNITNGGLHAFCANFSDHTNTTTCSAVNEFLELGWNATWGMGGRAAATRAASAAVWASWACAAALLLARCLTAPDFRVKRTGVYLTQDLHQKITPYLKKSPRQPRSARSSPTKRDNASLRSEPTITTELVTASIEQGQDSVPTSIMATPVKSQRNSEHVEMTYTPQELFGVHR